MNFGRSASLSFSLGLAAAVGLSVGGCESGGDSDLEGQYLRVEPGQVTLSKTQTTVALSAAGGKAPYVWSVTDSSLGTVTTNGSKVTYTRTTKNGLNIVRLLDGQGWTAHGEITQQDDEAALTLSPTTATLDSNGDQIVFKGTGGAYPYRWSVGNAARGTLNSSDGSQVLYTRKTEGDNTVILKDQQDHLAVADITQPGAPAVSITPGTTSVATNGGVQVFTAVGGTSPFTWSFYQQVPGSLLTPAGGIHQTAVFKSGGAGSEIIKVVDANSNEAYATITKN